MVKKNRRDHAKFICDVGELSGLFTDSNSLENFLQHTAELIAEHMNSDVCSIYLYNENKRELVLKANKGLNREFIGRLTLKFGEGLTGLALKELRPICERHASKNPNFRYFPGLGEERFESFLVVPIIRGTTRIGAIVIQNTLKNYFSDEDIYALKAITSQLANTIEMTKLFLSLEERPVKRIETPVVDFKFVKGRSGADGFAIAPVFVFKNLKELRLEGITPPLKKYTLDDFYRALEQTEEQLKSWQKSVDEKLSDVASLIFTAQILMLKDKGFIDSIAQFIQKGINPPQAIVEVINLYLKKFEQIENPYLKEKSQDVRDIGQRLLENLLEKEMESQHVEDHIIIARDLFPSDVLKLSSQNIKGLILLSGGVTGHIAILAQSLHIPLILAEDARLLSVPYGTKIAMDAEQGNVYINPAADVLKTFKEREESFLEYEENKEKLTATTHSADGSRVVLMANINLLGDLKNAVNFKSEGIGLYRTEFPFMVRDNFPTEEEQYLIYKKLIDGMPDKEITIRTLDIGGDKALSYFEDHLKEKNPYLGLRSIRFSLKHKDIFISQMRAILRAGTEGKLRIMFPMISSIDEFVEAKEVLYSCMEQLKKDGLSFQTKPKIGVMIELPAVVEIIDELAQEADFFSIGTNDFIQYMLAVDRTNERVSNLYLPHHPAILRAIKKIVDAAHRHKIDVSICGDMAHDVKYLSFFLGIGVRKFSVNPRYLPRMQLAIKKVNVKAAKKLMENLLKKPLIKDLDKIISQ